MAEALEDVLDGGVFNALFAALSADDRRGFGDQIAGLLELFLSRQATGQDGLAPGDAPEVGLHDLCALPEVSRRIAWDSADRLRFGRTRPRPKWLSGITMAKEDSPPPVQRQGGEDDRVQIAGEGGEVLRQIGDGTAGPGGLGLADGALDGGGDECGGGGFGPEERFDCGTQGGFAAREAIEQGGPLRAGHFGGGREDLLETFPAFGIH